MDNLFDRCLMARGFLRAMDKHNPLNFNRLSWRYLFDGCLIQRERPRQSQTAAEGFPKPFIVELGLRMRFVFAQKYMLTDKGRQVLRELQEKRKN